MSVKIDGWEFDDSALGCPLKSSVLTPRQYVDWEKVRNLLIKAGVLKNCEHIFECKHIPEYEITSNFAVKSVCKKCGDIIQL